MSEKAIRETLDQINLCITNRPRVTLTPICNSTLTPRSYCSYYLANSSLGASAVIMVTSMTEEEALRCL